MIDTVRNMLWFAVPIRVVNRPDGLEVRDNRPTWPMFLSAIGFMVFTVAFAAQLLGVDIGVDAVGMWASGALAVGCLAVSLRGTICQAYYFDRATSSYAFVRRYPYKKDLIEGGLDPFRAVRVHQYIDRSSKGNTRRYVVSLLQDGLTLGGGYDQPLRDDGPILGTHANATRIGSAIATFLDIPLHDTSD